jgi:phosphatidylinositol-3-phosphatase
VANVVVAPGVKPGTVSAGPVDHYSLLRATDEMLGLPLLGHASAATSLRSDFGI